jgi:glycosyl transferase family 25
MSLQSFKSYFDHVYVLTIPRAKERQQHILSEFADWNIDFFYGVDKHTVNVDECIRDKVIDLEKNKLLDPKSVYSEGFISCALGHRMIYKDILEKQYTRVLILEDDALINWKVEGIIEKICAAIPKDAELIYWGWLGGVLQNPDYPFYLRRLLYLTKKSLGLLKKFDASEFEGMTAAPYNKYFDVAGKHAGTHAYSITREAAEKLIHLQTPVIFHADRLLTHAIRKGEIKAYISLFPVLTEASYSGNSKKLPSLLAYR